MPPVRRRVAVPRSFLAAAAAAMLVTSCSRIADLGPQPFACTASAPACPDGYACDLQSNACEYACAADGSCPLGLTCDPQLFCVLPCTTNDDCTASFNDSAHTCSAALKFCVPAR